LIVCIGNTCRSAMYHNYLAKKQLVNTEIYSAGVNVKEEKINQKAVNVLNNHNIAIVKDNTNAIKEYSQINFDDIIVLDKEIDISKLPKSRRIIKSYIEDPVGKKEKEYEVVYQKIVSLINSPTHLKS